MDVIKGQGLVNQRTRDIATDAIAERVLSNTPHSPSKTARMRVASLAACQWCGHDKPKDRYLVGRARAGGVAVRLCVACRGPLS